MAISYILLPANGIPAMFQHINGCSKEIDKTIYYFYW